MRPVFEYSNYRAFLADYYQHQKLVNPQFSHRYFLAKAGMAGPNFLKNIIDNKRNLSPAGIKKFAAALELPACEAHYFETLVLFNQAKTAAKKQSYFNSLSGFLHRTDIGQIRTNQYDYFSHWYNIAVREYIHCHPFRNDYKTLVKTIFPRITIKQAKKAVQLLLDLKLIAPGDDGSYRLTDAIITTGPEIASLGAHEYHKTMLDITREALDAFPADQRYIRSITGSFSEETYNQIMLLMDQTRKKVLEMIDAGRGERKVYQIGMQLFPLVSTKKRRRSS